MNKYVVIALIISAVAAVAAYRYYAPAMTGCSCANCPCEETAVVVEEVTTTTPAEEQPATEAVEEQAAPVENDTCCGHQHDEVK